MTRHLEPVPAGDPVADYEALMDGARLYAAQAAAAAHRAATAAVAAATIASDHDRPGEQRDATQLAARALRAATTWNPSP